MALGMEVGLGSDHIALDGDPATSQKRGQSPPIFGPFLLVGLGPGDVLLDAVAVPPKRGTAPQFSAHF